MRPRSSSSSSKAPPRQANRWRARALVAALAITTLWAGAATWFIVFHDEALARFVSQQSAMQYGYEERIGALRAQLDRSALERSATRDGVETRIAELAQRQAAMETRQALLAALAASGAQASAIETELTDKPLVVAPRVPPSRKPFPTPDGMESAPALRTRDANDGAGRQSAREITHRIARIDSRLDGLAEAQARAVDGIGVRAGAQAQRLRGLVARVGLDLSRFERPGAAGLGGPLVPFPADPFGLALALAERALGDEARLRRIAAALPTRRPIQGGHAISSGYGARVDPFTRGLALHTGIDLKAEQGEPARAAAAGRVTLADYSGGYGNLVEIDHGAGLSTRYAHLSTFSVAPGQIVAAGSVIGRVGSTGRSTGSHLHYETRIDGEPVDPQRFLRAGESLDMAVLAQP